MPNSAAASLDQMFLRLVLEIQGRKQPITMIPAAKRFATASGIALYIKHLLSTKTSNAIYDAMNPGRFHPSAGDDPSDAILPIDGNEPGSEPNCRAKTA